MDQLVFGSSALIVDQVNENEVNKLNEVLVKTSRDGWECEIEQLVSCKWLWYKLSILKHIWVMIDFVDCVGEIAVIPIVSDESE